jgi:Purple acid Phosphatase, N-terminal domain/Calcineurin-like phosphoesterase
MSAVPWLLLALCVPAPAGDEAPDAAFAARWTPLEGTRPAQVRIVWTGDPATEATVSWTTAEAGMRHRVLYDVVSHAADGAYASDVATHRDGPYTRSEHDDAPTAFFHHARLAGLRPATTYRFRVESDGRRSRELCFTTAPDDDRPVSILVGGDSRSGWRERCFVNSAIAALCAADDGLLALSHGGDYVLHGDRWDDWTRWLSHQELTTTAGGRVLPIVPTRGNHDYGPLFDEVFDAPGGAGLDYFTTRLGPSVTLITLNSNLSAAGDQLAWLESQLAAARGSRWILASYHRALYPAVKTPGEAKPFWVPVFEHYGLDVALESDGHCIKRTLPIRGDAPSADGTVYLGEGGLGVPQRTPHTDLWYLQPPGMVTNGHHVMRLDFAPGALRVRTLRFPDPPAPLAPELFRVVVPPHARWSYLAGAEPPAGWTGPGFDASAWPAGEAGFGYGDDDDRTVLETMRGSYAELFVRRTFDAAALDGTAELTLMCRYDDAFVAYLNGVEVARAGVEAPADAEDDPRVASHEAREVEAFPLAGWRERVRPGTNVLALVGYNRMARDSDFTLDPWLAGDRLGEAADRVLVPEVIDDVSLAPRGR